MTSVGYVRALRARWFTVVTTTLIVTCIAVLIPPAPRSFSQPSTAFEDVGSEAHTRFRTTATLGIPPTGGDVETQIRAISFYLRSSEVQTAFAQEIGYTGNNRALLSRLVTVAVSPSQGAVNVSGYGGTKQQAAAMATSFITALEGYLAGVRAEASARALAKAQATVDGLNADLGALAVQLQAARAAAVADDPDADPDAGVPTTPAIVLLEAQRVALSASYGEALQTLTRLSNAAATPPSSQLTVLTPPSAQSATEIPPALVYRLPIRIAIGLLLGLLLGAALALIAEHLSRKVSSRDTAERAFRSRVLAEIPKRRISGTLKDVVALSAPKSSVASAYRMLRAVLLTTDATTPAIAATRQSVPVPVHRPDTASAPTGESSRQLTRVLSRALSGRHVEAASRTEDERSPNADGTRATRTYAEGATNGWPQGSPSNPGALFVLVAPAEEPILPVVVANLAAVFAEVWASVIVLRLGASSEGGDTGSYVSPGGGDYDVWARETAVPGVQTVDWQSGPGTAPLVAVVEALRADGSAVIVDAGRAATAEFAEIAPSADGVVAVCEYGATRVDEADRAADIIGWSRGNFVGVVLAQVPNVGGRWFSWGRRRSSPLGHLSERSVA